MLAQTLGEPELIFPSHDAGGGSYIEGLSTLKRSRRLCRVKRRCDAVIVFKIKRSPRANSPVFCLPVRHRDCGLAYLISSRSVSHGDQSSFSSSPAYLVFSKPGSSDGRTTPLSQHSATAAKCSVPGQSRIRIASLLSDPLVTSYHLEVIQNPQRTAEFGSAILSRLPLTPPIVVRLTVRDHTGNAIFPEAELPFLVAHLSLFTEDGSSPLDMVAAPGSDGDAEEDYRRLLYGSLVSSAHILDDLSGQSGLFFIFADVSIRFRGRYKLGVTLFKLFSTSSTGVTQLGQQGHVLAQTRTLPFDVLPNNEYTAAPPTPLTECFQQQGAAFPSVFFS